MHQSTVDEWARLISATKEEEHQIDVYAEKKKDHNTMDNMYKEIPDEALETHKFGLVYYLLSGLATINTILRHTLLPKYGDQRMIRGHSINLLQLFDVVPQKLKVVSLIVKTIKRTVYDQKRCGYAPHIQEIINSKMKQGAYLLDKEHLPLLPEFEDNTVVMDANDPSSLAAHEKKEKARAAKAAKCQVQQRLQRSFSSPNKTSLGF